MSIVDPNKNKKKTLSTQLVWKMLSNFLLREIYIMLALLYIYIYIDTLIRDFLKNRLSYYNYVIYWYYYKFTTKGGVISTQNKKGNKF